MDGDGLAAAAALGDGVVPLDAGADRAAAKEAAQRLSQWILAK
jgi:hypothetical protein